MTTQDYVEACQARAENIERLHAAMDMAIDDLRREMFDMEQFLHGQGELPLPPARDRGREWDLPAPAEAADDDAPVSARRLAERLDGLERAIASGPLHEALRLLAGIRNHLDDTGQL